MGDQPEYCAENDADNNATRDGEEKPKVLSPDIDIARQFAEKWDLAEEYQCHTKTGNHQSKYDKNFSHRLNIRTAKQLQPFYHALHNCGELRLCLPCNRNDLVNVSRLKRIRETLIGDD